LREKMGKAAAKSAAERHDIKRQVEKLTSVYDKVAVRTSR
jgi:hypothetical protein